MPNNSWLVAACGALLLCACATGKGGGGPIVPADADRPAEDEAGIGYPTVGAARRALEARDDVETLEEDGWTLIEDAEAGTVWSFTPPDHPAHPTVVKRTVVEQPGEDDIEMHGRCEADRNACKALIRKFEYQNARLTGSPMGLHQQPTGAAADLPPIGGLMR